MLGRTGCLYIAVFKRFTEVFFTGLLGQIADGQLLRLALHVHFLWHLGVAPGFCRCILDIPACVGDDPRHFDPGANTGAAAPGSAIVDWLVHSLQPLIDAGFKLATGQVCACLTGLKSPSWASPAELFAIEYAHAKTSLSEGRLAGCAGWQRGLHLM